MNLKRLILAAWGLAMAGRAYGECLSCWTLEAVQIQVSSGAVLTGYIPWNDGWVELNGRRLTAIEALTSKEAAVLKQLGNLNLQLYPELLELSFDPLKGKRLATKPPITLTRGDIIDVKHAEGPHTGYSGAGLIQEVSPFQVKRLKAGPAASCLLEDKGSLADCYWLDFNATHDSKEINFLCKSPVGKLVEPSPRMLGEGVMRICFAYD
jgi:hypothetical protein